MSGDKSLINFEDLLGLGGTAKTLIEKISSGAGIVFEPHRIRRRAKAEADGEKLRALAQLEILDEYEARGLVRLAREEGKRQENIESITAGAAAQLGETAKPEDMDDDWIAHFFERARIVSDGDMQTLWSRILAGEATKPGTFSKRAIEIVSNLEKKDAELFTKFCSFAWDFGGQLAPVITSTRGGLCHDMGIHVGVLGNLDSIGLIKFSPFSGFTRGPFNRESLIFYFEQPLGITFKNDTENELEIGQVMFTDVGDALARISGAKPSKAIFQATLNWWLGKRLALWSPVPINPQ